MSPAVQPVSFCMATAFRQVLHLVSCNWRIAATDVITAWEGRMKSHRNVESCFVSCSCKAVLAVSRCAGNVPKFMRWVQASGITENELNNCLLVTDGALRDGPLQPVPPTHFWGRYGKKSVIHAELLKKRTVMPLCLCTSFFFFLLLCWHFSSRILMLDSFQVLKFEAAALAQGNIFQVKLSFSLAHVFYSYCPSYCSQLSHEVDLHI